LLGQFTQRIELSLISKISGFNLTNNSSKRGELRVRIESPLFLAISFAFDTIAFLYTCFLFGCGFRLVVIWAVCSLVIFHELRSLTPRRRGGIDRCSSLGSSRGNPRTVPRGITQN
jgi:hypothetical protein